MKPTHAQRLLAAALAGALASAGCTHLGPKTVAVDRFDYSTAIADSWKQQTLLNIVKLRYMDLPVFVDVASIVSGYSLQTGVSVGGTVSSENAVQGDSCGGRASDLHRPAHHHLRADDRGEVPARTDHADRAEEHLLHAPDRLRGGLHPGTDRRVAQRSAQPVDVGGAVREADPEFVRVLELLREVQAAGAFGMRVEEDKAKGSTAVVFFRRDDVPADILEKAAEIRRLLKLPPEQQRFVLTYSPVRGAENELAVNSRSMLQILAAFASYIDVPEAHLEEHRAIPSLEDTSPEGRRSGCESTAARRSRRTPLPPCATAGTGSGSTTATGRPSARSRRSCSSSRWETGGTENLPLITIPAQ